MLIKHNLANNEAEIYWR